jgi:hypothetical protein
MVLFNVLIAAATGMLLWEHVARPESADGATIVRRRSATMLLAAGGVASCLGAYVVWSFRRAAAEEISFQLAFGYALYLVVLPLLVLAGILALAAGTWTRRVSHRVLLAAAVVVPVAAACVVPVGAPGPRNPPHLGLLVGGLYACAAAVVVARVFARHRWRGLLRLLLVGVALLFLVAVVYAREFVGLVR